MSDARVLELVLPSSVFSSLKQAAEQRKRTEAELALEAIQSYLGQPTGAPALLGLFADEPELIDNITQDAMQSREKNPLRLAEVIGG